MIKKILNPFSSIKHQSDSFKNDVNEAKNIVVGSYAYVKEKKAKLQQIKDFFSEENYQEALKIYKLKSLFFNDYIRIIDKEYLHSLLNEYHDLSIEEFNPKFFLYENVKPYKKKYYKIDDDVIWLLIVELIELREQSYEN